MTVNTTIYIRDCGISIYLERAAKGVTSKDFNNIKELRLGASFSTTIFVACEKSNIIKQSQIKHMVASTTRTGKSFSVSITRLLSFTNHTLFSSTEFVLSL